MNNYAPQMIVKTPSLWHVLATQISAAQTPSPDYSWGDEYIWPKYCIYRVSSYLKVMTRKTVCLFNSRSSVIY